MASFVSVQNPDSIQVIIGLDELFSLIFCFMFILSMIYATVVYKIDWTCIRFKTAARQAKAQEQYEEIIVVKEMAPEDYDKMEKKTQNQIVVISKMA